MRPKDGFRLLLLGAIWGVSYPLIKVALRTMPILVIVGGRLVIGAALLAAVLAVRRLRLPRRELWPLLLLMSVVAQIIPFLLITWGEESISASVAAILNSTTPLFTVLIVALALREERPGPVRLAGIGLGFAGVAVIVGWGEVSSLLGDLAVVLAAGFYALGFVIARKKLTGIGYSSLELSAGQLMAGALVMVPVSGGQWAARGPEAGLLEAVCLLLLGALGTGFAYLLYYRLVADTGATTASMVTYLIPVFGAATGWAFLGEHLGWSALGGAVMVIAGIIIAERFREGGRRRREPERARLEAREPRPEEEARPMPADGAPEVVAAEQAGSKPAGGAPEVAAEPERREPLGGRGSLEAEG